MSDVVRKPDFLIIGAQKAGTTWLWNMLKSHPGTSLPRKKELHFFSASENYARGIDSYWEWFRDSEEGCITGEASTTYLSDKVAFFYNEVNRLEYDESLPALPELVLESVPDAKIIVSLRDPVRRAISAYFHFMRRGKLPVNRGLRRTVQEHPRLRILELGDYATHLSPWFATFPREQILVLVFEDDIVANPASGLSKLYEFLGLEAMPLRVEQEKKVNKSWTWTQTVANYYAGPLRRFVRKGPAAELIRRYDWLRNSAIKPGDIRYLQDFYLPFRSEVSQLVEKDLDSWTYGTDYN